MAPDVNVVTIYLLLCDNHSPLFSMFSPLFLIASILYIVNFITCVRFFNYMGILMEEIDLLLFYR